MRQMTFYDYAKQEAFRPIKKQDTPLVLVWLILLVLFLQSTILLMGV